MMQLTDEFEHSFLLFETEFGEGELICASEIKQLLDSQSNLQLDLVILQACHSENVGEVFRQKGAKHVICINQDRSVLDEAAITFSENLYKNLFRGQTICAAFNHAVEQAKVVLGRDKEHEAEKDSMFILKLAGSRESNASKRNHKCKRIVDPGKTPEGPLKCLSDHVFFKKLPHYDEKIAKYRS